ncbi:B3/B4 domain-containing protein [Companilactobacillus keshanensis]|uniref:B3/4 domain-containing protein n=1 Tax=Companilactobacillus keshanensis TaxID=2486003 RepID=A0ABW4BTX0_9LACO|nr:phenylalanine--tRNA ligase beta subunit-related protein [Companilactobacillus keshanensis]
MNFKIDDKLKNKVSLGITVINFENQEYDQKMWDELLNPLNERISHSDTLETIREDPTIIATKKIYKDLGKDPSRFRPSSDSLWRRLIKGKGLYQINALVDLNNYFSLIYKLPFGSYDIEKISDDVTLTTGKAGATYHGIGKKAINLENMLLLEDDESPFGGPTSDSTRAMISNDTKKAVIVAYMFGLDDDSKEDVQTSVKKYAKGYLQNISIKEQRIIE